MRYKKFKLKPVLMCTIIAMMVLSLVHNPLALEPMDSQNPEQTENMDIVRSLGLQIKMKGETEYKDFSEPYQIKDSSKLDKLKANYSFELLDTTNESGEAARTMKGGDYYLIKLPNEINIINPSNDPIAIKDAADETIANFSFTKDTNNDWQIKVEFTDYINDMTTFDIYGSFSFEFDLNLDGITAGKPTTIYIPIDNKNSAGIEVTKPVPPATTPNKLEKKVAKYDASNRKIVWDILMSPENGVFEGCTFKDTIDPNTLTLESIKHGNVELTSDDYTYDSTTGLLSYTIPKGRNGKDYGKITITTKINSSVFNNNTVKTITNQSSLEGGEQDVNLTSNTASQKIEPNWLNKSGSVIDGNKIEWTINANNTNQNIYDVVVTDTLQKDLILDKTSLRVDGNTIAIYENSHSPANTTEIYAIYTEETEHNKLKIYFPRTATNASTSKYVIKLITSVVTPDTVTKDPVEYSNVASIDGKFLGDGPNPYDLKIGIDGVGVGVPNVAIIKSHQALSDEDKRNGTITWTLKTVSNLSDYGKSVITDTLPDDQDYIPESIKLGDMSLTASTNPKAEINGKTLTITFSNSKALSSQQTITLKTKIKTEIYGDNINRDFTNQAKVDLYDTNNSSIVTSANDSDTVSITNTVISKNASQYNGHVDKTTGDKPRVDFNITINDNLMPLKNVVVTDNLNNIKTKFKKTGEDANDIDNVKWTYVAGSIKITKVKGNRDSFDLAKLANNLVYDSTSNTLTFDFGKAVEVNDCYKITFTAELDPTQNDIFKENGTIKCYGNSAGIKGDNLKPEIIATNGLGDFDIKNEVLGKSGFHEVKDQQIIWTINLNQHSIGLDNPNVIDVLPEGLTLDPVSLKLYKNVINSNGNFVSGDDVDKCDSVDFKYEYKKQEGSNRYVLSVTLPKNNTSYILRFATDIDSKILGQTIKNEAYYSSSDTTPGNNSLSSVSLTGGAGGGSTKKSSITVNKFSKDNGVPVNGAVFQLDWINSSNEKVPVRQLTASTKGSITFFGLTRGEKYSITEVKNPDGYLLDSKDPIMFNVQPNGEIHLDNADNTKIDKIDFYNTPIKAGTWSPAAIKELAGKNLIHTFDFEIKDDNNSLLMTGKNDSKNSNSSNIKFELVSNIEEDGLLSFEDSHIFSETDLASTEYLVKEFKLKINEVSNKYDGNTQTNKAYTYDPTTKEITVKVFNVKGAEKLQIRLYDESGNLISDNDGKFLTGKTPTFTNTYKASGDITLLATKKLTGHALANKQFSFELYEGTTLLQTKTNNAGTKNKDGSYTGDIKFDKINYDETDVGTKTYTIKEVNSNQNGYSYDNRTYTVTVTISDDDKGNLTSEITKVTTKADDGAETTIDDKKVEFNNTYTTGSTTLDLTATKKLTGRTIENEQFEFVLSKVDNTSGNNPKPIESVSNDANGKITFSSLTYNQDDRDNTYYYQIAETDSKNPGYTYDSSKYIITVKVIDNHDGTINTETSVTKNGEPGDISAISFENEYHADGILELAATKELDGKALEDNAFSYELKKVGEDKPIETVKNRKDGTINFTNLKYTENDVNKEYNYTISEVNDSKKGYTYDNNVYNINVKISDNGDGTLKVEKTVTLNDARVDRISFKNIYRANGQLTLTATKTLDGKTLPNGKFTYILNEIDSSGNIIKEISKTTNDSDGNIAFEKITYDQSNINEDHYYTISEVNDGIGGYTYDSNIYYIYVDVIDNDNGTLTVDPVITLNDQRVEKITFNNKYQASGELVLTATKSLAGKPLLANQFSFELKQVDKDGKEIKLIETVKNDENGNITFKPIKYNETNIDQDNEFYYTISEVNNGIGGYTYDNTIYTIHANIIDNDNGTLTVNVNDFDLENIKFENDYKASGELTLTATKTLDGKTLPNDKFTYILTEYDSDGNLVGEVERTTNNAKGNITFETFKFDQSNINDEHYYTIHELDDNPGGYTYDESVYNIYFIVDDSNDNGKLIIDPIITLNDEIVDEITFNNKYAASGELNLSATKILEGKDLPDEQFSFTLKEVTEDGEELIETVKNDSDGNIVFETLTYDERDIDQRYHYTISEVNDEIGGYTYDDNIYHIYVDVIDNDNGTLTIDYIITLNDQDIEEVETMLEIEDIIFTNQYEAHGSIKLTANKILENAKLTDKMFNFILTEDNNILQTKSNNHDGLIEFDEINYDLDDLGTHIYTIYEQTDNNSNIKYDLSKYTVTIEVSDKNNGILDTQVTIEKDSNLVDEINFTNQYIADIVDTSDHSDISMSVYSLIASSLLLTFMTLRRKKFN